MCCALPCPALTPQPSSPGVLTTSFEENPRLKDFFKVLALSLDNKGLPYIAMMEAIRVRGGRRRPFCVREGGRGVQGSRVSAAMCVHLCMGRSRDW